MSHDELPELLIGNPATTDVRQLMRLATELREYFDDVDLFPVTTKSMNSFINSYKFKKMIFQVEGLRVDRDSDAEGIDLFIYRALCYLGWAQFGFNTFQLSNEDVARFYSMNVDTLSDVRLPFGSQLLLVPDGWSVPSLFAFGWETPDDEYKLGYITNAKSLITEFDQQVSFTTTGIGWPDSPEDESSFDEKQMRFNQKITSGFAAWLSTERATAEPKKSFRYKKKKRGDVAKPKLWLLKSETHLPSGVVTAIKEGSRDRERAALSLQHIVRGHRKQQRHGPGRQSTKWIWVEPYWRGPASEAAWARFYK